MTEGENSNSSVESTHNHSSDNTAQANELAAQSYRAAASVDGLGLEPHNVKMRKASRVRIRKAIKAETLGP
jgi:hypothetical protein